MEGVGWEQSGGWVGAGEGNRVERGKQKLEETTATAENSLPLSGATIVTHILTHTRSLSRTHALSRTHSLSHTHTHTSLALKVMWKKTQYGKLNSFGHLNVREHQQQQKTIFFTSVKKIVCSKFVKVQKKKILTDGKLLFDSFIF